MVVALEIFNIKKEEIIFGILNEENDFVRISKIIIIFLLDD